VHSDTPACRSRSRRATWLCEVCHSSSIALRFRQRPGLDQQALSFTVSTPAEANHHGVPWTFRLGSTREQRISGGQEFKITETGVSQACGARIFHDEKITRTATSVTLPGIIQRLPVLASPKPLSTLLRRFACARLSRPRLPESCPGISATLATTAFNRSSLRWLGSAPDRRTRRALLHLSYSCARPFGQAMLVTQDPQRTFGRVLRTGSSQ
jgi:hypothetical protein